MPSPSAVFRGFVSRVLPTRNADSSNIDVASRLDTYGGLFTQPMVRKAHALADEGSYFTTNNGQTGITTGLPTGFVATTPLIIIQNGASVSAGTQIYLDYIALTAITAITAASAATVVQAAIVLDSTLRYSSGGTTLAAYKSSNMNNTQAGSVGTAYCGALTATAASGAARTIVGVRTARPAASATALTVVGDQLTFNFGGVEGGQNGNITILNPTLVTMALPPVIIGPQQSMLFYLWYASTTPAGTLSWAPEIAQWER